MEKYYHIAAGIAALGVGVPFLYLLVEDTLEKWRTRHK